MTQRDQRALRALMGVAIAKGCIMCHQPADFAGMFIPDDSVMWGAKPGKQRLLVYGICTGCRETTTIPEREQRLEQRLGLAA